MTDDCCLLPVACCLLTDVHYSVIDCGVFTAKFSRPYFDAWLRRTGRQLAISGRLTQIATALAKEDACQVGEWQLKLRGLLDGNLVPSLEVLTRIDALLASSPANRSIPDSQGVLPLGI